MNNLLIAIPILFLAVISCGNNGSAAVEGEATEHVARRQYDSPVKNFSVDSTRRPVVMRMESLNGTNLKRVDIAIIAEIKRLYDFNLFGGTLQDKERFGLYDFERVENMRLNRQDTVNGLIMKWSESMMPSYLFWNSNDTITMYRLKNTGHHLINDNRSRFRSTIEPMRMDAVRMISENTIGDSLPPQYWEPRMQQSTTCFGVRLYITEGVINKAEILKLYDAHIDEYQNR